MRSSLRNKKVLLGITGSVAAYKSIDLIRRLNDEGASVSAIMTGASLRFITPLSVGLAAKGGVYTGLFDDPLAHISLSSEADLMVVAPATANTICKFASGVADDLLSTCRAAFKGKLVIAPAMNWRMYDDPVVKRCLRRLRNQGAIEVRPAEGALACGEEGRGRMAPVQSIVEACIDASSPKDMAGKKVVVTAGPTREHLDSVRFISNRSSGRMGYALAVAARRRGADVVLVSGPSCLKRPEGIKFVDVVSASQMREAVLAAIKGAALLVMAAAVADFSPAYVSEIKLPKSKVGRLELLKTADILAEVGAMKKRPFLVGFAAESGMNVKRAMSKLGFKGAELIVLNDIDDPEAGFDVETNRVVIVGRLGQWDVPLMSKADVAWAVLDRALACGA